MFFYMFPCRFWVKEHNFTFVLVDGESCLMEPYEYLVCRFRKFGGGGFVRRTRRKDVAIVDVEAQVGVTPFFGQTEDGSCH